METKKETSPETELYIWQVIGDNLGIKEVGEQITKGEEYAFKNPIVFKIAAEICNYMNEQLNEKMKLIKTLTDENEKIKQEHNKWKKEVIDCTELNELLTAQVVCRDEEIERLSKRIKEISKQLYCSDKNQEKEHGKLLNQIALFNQQVKKRKKAENELKIAKEEIARLTERIKNLEADLEEGGFNDERNFI